MNTILSLCPASNVFTVKDALSCSRVFVLIFTPGRIVDTINRCRVPLINRNIGVRQGNVFQIDRQTIELTKSRRQIGERCYRLLVSCNSFQI